MAGGAGRPRPNPRAAVKLLDVTALPRIWRGWPGEGAIALIAALGGVAVGVLWSLLNAVAVTIGQLIYRAARPHRAPARMGPSNATAFTDPQPPSDAALITMLTNPSGSTTTPEGDDVCGVAPR